MKYLKYFESFYSPVKATYKSNIGNDYMNDTGGNTYPLNKMKMGEYDIAYKKGQEAFGKDETNIYIDQEYPNTELIKAFNDGLENAKKNKEIKEMFVDRHGKLHCPACLKYEEQDTLDTAFDKGELAFKRGYNLDENPYTLEQHPDMSISWSDGYKNAEYNHIDASKYN